MAAWASCGVALRRASAARWCDGCSRLTTERLRHAGDRGTHPSEPKGAPVTVTMSQTAIEHKPHFLTLDGLRGVAAISVACFHVLQVFGGRPFLAHAPLAVDFFFILSGFVLSYAYSERIRDGSLSALAFAELRAVRLLPMILLGVLVGAGATALSDQAGLRVIEGLIPSALTIPFPGTGTNGAYGYLDPPEWSLFFEFVASGAFFLWLRLRGSSRSLLLIITATGLAFATGAVLTGVPNLAAKWVTCPWGFPRVLFGVFLGVALNSVRHSSRVRGIRLPAWLIALILIACFWVPPLKQDAFFMVPVVYLLFPFLVIAGANWAPKFSWERRTTQLSASLSYPVYILHWPVLLWVRWVYERAHIPYGKHLHIYGLAGITIALGFSWVALKLYDEPIRARLKALRVLN